MTNQPCMGIPPEETTDELTILRRQQAALLNAAKDLLRAEWMVTHSWGGNRQVVLEAMRNAIKLIEADYE